METLFRSPIDGYDPREDMTPQQIRQHEAAWIKLNKTLDRFDTYLLSCPDRVKRYIDKHPLQRKNTDFFADLVLLDKENLNSVFRRLNKQTILSYQFQKRMEAAATLLQKGRLSEKQIAKKCGYSSMNSFRQAFKKVHQLTPLQYLNSK